MKKDAITTAAMARISTRKTADLIKDFELTEALPMSPELPTVRGWIMDELESRNPGAFWAWIESDSPSPRAFF